MLEWGNFNQTGESHMKNKTVSFPIEYLALLPVPLHEGVQHFIALCSVEAISSDIPTSANPRAQNLNTPLAKDIENSLKTNPHFGLLNRGMVITAKTAAYDEQDKQLTLELSNPDFHGCIDGGHTYKIIQKNKGNAFKGQFIQIEIFTGVESFFDQIATARNATCAVQMKSLAAARGQFDSLMEQLNSFPFMGRIATKQNEQSKEKDIDILHIISLLTLFNPERYDNNKHPVIALTPARCLTQYLKDTENSPNPYEKMQGILSDIFSLQDYAISHMEQAFTTYRKGIGSQDRKTPRSFNQLIGLKPIESKLFNGDVASYTLSRELYFPILATLRPYVQENNQTRLYEWKTEPMQILENLLGELSYRSVQNAYAIGKGSLKSYADFALWGHLISVVLTDMMERELARAGQ